MNDPNYHVIDYLRHHTQKYYRDYPKQLEPLVISRFNEVFERMLKDAQQSPDKLKLKVLSSVEFNCDDKGYATITQIFKNRYDIQLNSREQAYVKPCPQLSKSNTFLKDVPIDFEVWNATVKPTMTFKADNRFIFPAFQKKHVVTYSAVEHAKKEWEMAKIGQGTTVAFEVEGKIVHAHKTKLAWHSTYFQGMFASGMLESQEKSTIGIPNIEHAIFILMLEFLYVGQLTVEQIGDLVTAGKLMVAGNQLLIQPLVACCLARIEELLETKGTDVGQMTQLFGFAQLLESHELVEIALRYINANPHLKAALEMGLGSENVDLIVDIASKNKLHIVSGIVATWRPSQK